MNCPVCNKTLQPRDKLGDGRCEYICFNQATQDTHAIILIDKNELRFFHIFNYFEKDLGIKIFWNLVGWQILEMRPGQLTTPVFHGKDILTVEQGYTLLKRYVKLWSFS